eukprot:gene6175-7689_t
MNNSNNNNNNNNDNNSNGNDENEVIHSGFLTKQGGKVHNWKIRWFILKKGSLSYYLTNVNWETSRPRGIIYLNSNTEVKETDYKNRRHCFTISNTLNNNNNNEINIQQINVTKSPPTSPRKIPNRNNSQSNNNNNLSTTPPITSNTPPNIYQNTTNSSPPLQSTSPPTTTTTTTSTTTTTNRIYLISAQTVFDQKKWIEKIKSACKVDNNNQLPIFKKSLISPNTLRDMVTWKRKDSLPSGPTLLNRTIATESINDMIRVSLSKRKFYFYHDNLTVPSLSYIDSNGIDMTMNSPTLVSNSNTTTGSSNNSQSSPPSNHSTSPVPSRSTSPNNINPNNQQQQNPNSPFYSPITYLGSTNTNNTPILSNSSSSSSTSTSPNNISPNLSPNLTPGTPPNRIPQPKIIVHHLVKDSFQITNIGGCSFNFEIFSPFDLNYRLSFIPSSGEVKKGESVTIVVELMVYNPIEMDVYSTLHIRGGMEFTLYCRVETDPYLPLFLQSCSGVELSLENKNKLHQFIKANPTLLKSLQELAHTMISEGRYINPKTNYAQPLVPTKQLQFFSRVRLSKYTLTFSGKQNGSGPAKIYQLLNDKFLISNSGNSDCSFQFHIPNSNFKNNLFSLSLVPTNGILGKGEWFYVKSSLTVFEQTEISDLIQLIINQREVYYILMTVKCENIHPGNKEIDIDNELMILDRLGTGATGEVFKALISSNDLKHHLSQIGFDHGYWIRRSPSDSNIVVAVKKLHEMYLTEPSSEMIQDFYNEVRVLSMLNHPNIVKYVGGCTKIGNWAIVMEYLPGGNLMDVLADSVVNIPFKLILRMALDIAQGLHYLHSLGILHLDLKSPNLLVASLSLNAKVHVKVADFNTCINRSRLTGFFGPKGNRSAGNLAKKGTTLWMAPEVIKGSLYSEKCDVYSFGIILWEMLTRSLPYSDISFNCEIEERVLQGMRPPIPDACDRNYARLMECCWDPIPEKRPYFDSIIHILTKMIQDLDIEEQKVKASFRGLRRAHSGSSILSISKMNANNFSPPGGNNMSPPSVEQDPKSKAKSKRFSSQHVLVGSSFLKQNVSDLDISTISINNISRIGFPLQLPKNLNYNNNNQNNNNNMINRNNDNSDEKINQQQQQNFNNNNSSTITVSTNNDSNLPFKFSPPSTPQSSFLQLKKVDNDLKKTMKNSFIRYKPSFVQPAKINVQQNFT